ncbi:hypothetical protein SMICM304S_03441 [Streptomyces microflavus]
MTPWLIGAGLARNAALVSELAAGLRDLDVSSAATGTGRERASPTPGGGPDQGGRHGTATGDPARGRRPDRLAEATRRRSPLRCTRCPLRPGRRPDAGPTAEPPKKGVDMPATDAALAEMDLSSASSSTTPTSVWPSASATSWRATGEECGTPAVSVSSSGMERSGCRGLSGCVAPFILGAELLASGEDAGRRLALEGADQPQHRRRYEGAALRAGRAGGGERLRRPSRSALGSERHHRSPHRQAPPAHS